MTDFNVEPLILAIREIETIDKQNQDRHADLEDVWVQQNDIIFEFPRFAHEIVALMFRRDIFRVVKSLNRLSLLSTFLHILI